MSDTQAVHLPQAGVPGALEPCHVAIASLVDPFSWERWWHNAGSDDLAPVYAALRGEVRKAH